MQLPDISAHRLRLALYQPDMPQNTGAMLRLCACLGLGMDIIEPCGFVLDDARLKRVAMDYAQLAAPVRHRGWDDFHGQLGARRLILLTTKAGMAYTGCAYRPDDVFLVGQESAGVPEAVHQAAHLRVTVPLASGARSLNVAMAAAMVAGEAIRQLGNHG
ncbi:MAG: TrmH family RNA methyltransferase [Alphaproteobacteria bacterium]